MKVHPTTPVFSTPHKYLVGCLGRNISSKLLQIVSSCNFDCRDWTTLLLITVYGACGLVYIHDIASVKGRKSQTWQIRYTFRHRI